MFSERVSAILSSLDATNTEIAYYAGCTPSHISRIKSGARRLKPKSAAVAKFIKGIYAYADSRNQLSQLCLLCGGKPEDGAGRIKGYILAWLFEGNENAILEDKPVAQHKVSFRSFGEKLSAVMDLYRVIYRQIGASWSM